MTLVEACELLRGRMASYLADKRGKVARGELIEVDDFPSWYCPAWYCAKYLDKVPTLTAFVPAAAAPP